MKYVAITLLIIISGYSSSGEDFTSAPININDITVTIPVTEVHNVSDIPPQDPTTNTTVAPITTPAPPPNSTTKPSTTTNAPTTTKVTTLAPNTTTIAPNTTTIAPNTTTIAPNSTTVAPKTTTIPPNTTTISPNVTTAMPTAAPVTTPAPPHNRRFDGPSFIGGIILALGLVAIGFVAFKFYKARTELNYHTL